MNTPHAAAAAAAILFMATASAQAANVTVDCNKKASINSALGKLDRSVANTVTIVGTCVENVVVNSHRDLTIVTNGGGVAADVATVSDTIPMYIQGNSRVTLRGLAMSGGGQVVYCDDRSTCILDGVTVSGGLYGGVSAQKQSSLDIVGTTSIAGSGGNGLGVFGASSANVGANVTISGHGGSGVAVQDGSFLRVDGGTISGNDSGVFVDRGALAKLLGTQITSNTGGSGVFVRASSVQLSGATITGNSSGVFLEHLSFVAFQGGTSVSGNPGGNVICSRPTSTTNVSSACGT